jgi:hypothetical protein
MMASDHLGTFVMYMSNLALLPTNFTQRVIGNMTKLLVWNRNLVAVVRNSQAE